MSKKKSESPKLSILIHLSTYEVGKECVDWPFAKDTGGYGVLWHFGRQKPATRVVWEAVYGPIAAGSLVCHKCDNPSCVRLDHLFVGTPKENAQDAKAKGRNAHGSKHGNAKLTDAQIAEIRSTYVKGGGVTQRVLAVQYGVDQSNISYICRSKTWAQPLKLKKVRKPRKAKVVTS
jgi:hypothetical protein